MFHYAFPIAGSDWKGSCPLLQDLVHVSESREILNDLFSNISSICMSKTSCRYFLLRITPEMETQLRFLLGNVILRSH